MSRVLVTGGYARKALETVRSLAEKGHEVTVACHQRTGVALWTKRASRRLVHADPALDPAGFVDAVAAETGRARYELVFPTGGTDTAALSAWRARLEPATPVAAPPADLIALARDRLRFLDRVASAGVPVPRTVLVASRAELDAGAAEVGYPVLLRSGAEGGGTGIHRVDGPAELARAASRRAWRYPLLVQHLVTGPRPPRCCAAVADHDGRPLFLFCYEVVRQFPRRYGASSFVRSIADPELEAAMHRVVEALGWRGVAEVDFVSDDRGVAHVIELNPRLWGPMALAMDCGIDVPGIMFRLYTGRRVDPIVGYEAGRYRRWLLPADLLWLASGPPTPARLGEFLRTPGPQRFDLLDPRDPLPALAQVAWMARYGLSPALWRRILDRT